MQSSAISYNPNIGRLIYPRFNKLCEWLNGTNKVTSENSFSEVAVKTSGVFLNATKVLWPLHVPLQVIGLFIDKYFLSRIQ